MIFALDTNIISYILRGDNTLKSRLQYEENNNNRSVIPLMVYYEIKRGLLASGATVKMKLFDNLCVTWKVNRFSKADMNTAAKIYAELKQKGRLIDDGDLLIAAQCITNDYTLVTNNTKHFQNIAELKYINWI